MSARRDRFRDIVETLTRHGWASRWAHLGLDRRFGPQGAPSPHRRPPRGVSLPVRVRLALEDLGAVYIKFGQIVVNAHRRASAGVRHRAREAPGRVPAHSVPPRSAPSSPRSSAPPRTGCSLRWTTFRSPPAPSARSTAAGSPGAGRRRIGRPRGAAAGAGIDVVVKVRRPGVVAQINEDLEIMAELAKRAERASTRAAGVHLAALVDEFSQTLRAELDYLQEARNVERFAANFAGDGRVHIPRVFWDTTTSRVLTLERIRGIKVNDAAALREAGIDAGELARRACNVLLKMVFEDGFFHADPHPGNFFVEADGRLGIIDFGMVGHISDSTRDQLVRMLVAVVDAGRRPADHGPGPHVRCAGGRRLRRAADGPGAARGPVRRTAARGDSDRGGPDGTGGPAARIPAAAAAGNGPAAEDAGDGGRPGQTAGSRVRADHPAGTLRAADRSSARCPPRPWRTG